MYRKLRDGKPVERNTRQQNELVQLQKGMYLFVCCFFLSHTLIFFFFFFLRSSRLSLFVTYGQIGTVKLVTTIRGTIELLQNLGKFYQAFSVHLKHQPSEQHTLKGAHEMVKGVSAYFKSAVDEVKSTINSNRVTSGPEGTISTKTATSLELVEKGLEKLDANFTEVNPDFKIKPEVCLTVQVENLRAVSHLKHPTCTVLEYSRDFGNTMHESLKRTPNWAAFYFTHSESYYPVPENKIALKDIPKMKHYL